MVKLVEISLSWKIKSLGSMTEGCILLRLGNVTKLIISLSYSSIKIKDSRNCSQMLILLFWFIEILTVTFKITFSIAKRFSLNVYSLISIFTIVYKVKTFIKDVVIEIWIF